MVYRPSLERLCHEELASRAAAQYDDPCVDIDEEMVVLAEEDVRKDGIAMLLAVFRRLPLHQPSDHHGRRRYRTGPLSPRISWRQSSSPWARPTR